MAEIVQDGVTGLHFEVGNSKDLADKIKWTQAHPAAMIKMGKQARKVYETYYTPATNYQQLIAIYQQLKCAEAIA
jgi:glycosyltransferase involved in cell wall biosynthesis